MVTIVRPLGSTGFRGEVGVEEHMASRGRLCAVHFGCYGVSKEIQRLVVRCVLTMPGPHLDRSEIWMLYRFLR